MSRRKSDQTGNKSNRPPATTPQDRENQLIAAAVDLAEQQILGGTASAQVITHFLKLGSSRERLEQEKINAENSLLATKKEVMESQKQVEALYAEALNAMRTYSGQTPTNDGPDYDDFED